MARPRKQPKIKEPIKLRSKPLANGNKSLYLDIYHNGKREYLFLHLYLIPEIDHAAKAMNNNTSSRKRYQGAKDYRTYKQLRGVVIFIRTLQNKAIGMDRSIFRNGQKPLPR